MSTAQEISNNRLLYLRWLARAHPDLYGLAIRTAQAARDAGHTLGALGWINFVIQAVATAGSALLQKKQIDKQVDLQKKALALSDAQAAAERDQAVKFKLLEVNTARAQAGQGPVDINGNPIAGASLPLPKQLAPYAGTGASGTWIPGVPNILTGIGAALLGVFALRALKVL